MSYTPILFRTSTFIELDVSTRCGSVDNVRTAEPQNRRVVKEPGENKRAVFRSNTQQRNISMGTICGNMSWFHVWMSYGQRTTIYGCTRGTHSRRNGKYFHLFLYSEITTSQVVDLIIGTPLVRRSGTPFFSRSFITTYLNMHKFVQSLDPIVKCHIREIG